MKVKLITNFFIFCVTMLFIQIIILNLSLDMAMDHILPLISDLLIKAISTTTKVM